MGGFRLMADTIDVDINVNTETGELDILAEKLSEVTGNEDVNVNVNVDDENLDGTQMKVDSLSNSDAEVNVNVDDSAVDETEAKVEGLDGSTVSVTVNADSSSVDETKSKIDDTSDSISLLGAALEGVAGAEIFSQLSAGIMELAESAGNYNDSMMRASLEAEGAGISAGNMKNAVSSLSDATGRAGGQIREAFITATARGITDMNSFTIMMKGAGAQATLFGTDIESMGNKFSQMAMRSNLMERSLASTGITMEELATAMGMSGATADEVKAKWKELDTNQRAAVLGQAASMNEGKNANEEYKNSWAGLHEQLDMAMAKISRVAGQIFLPVFIPAIKAAGNVLDWLGGIFDSVMKGPLGGFISIIGTGAAAIALAIPAYMALSAAFTFVTGPALAAASAIWAALSPLLPFIAIGAAIVFIIFEIGKAFGWWTDASSMIDAIGAGLNRLWSAFINHPDVQAAIKAISDAMKWLWDAISGAGKAILDFFGISTGGKFDIVRALIMSVGKAWDFLKSVIMGVVNVFGTIIDVASKVLSGQMDLQTAILTIWTSIQTNLGPILMSIARLVLRIFLQIASSAISAAAGLVGGVVTRIRQLPGRIFIILMQVIYNIISWGVNIVNRARIAATNFVNNLLNPIRALPGMIQSAVSSIANILFKPFQDAWNKIKPIIDSIKNAVSSVTGWLGDDEGGVGYYSDSEGVPSLNGTLNTTLSSMASNSTNNTSTSVNNNFYGLVEESAADYIIQAVNDRLRKEKIIKGV